MNTDTIDKEIYKVNKDIATLNNNLIKALEVATIEYINLYVYIDKANILLTRKTKLQHLKAVNI